jgi:branched-chain amino acid transport system permease protein
MAIAALSLNLILGYTGQLSLAHGAFYGIGAYACGLLILKSGLSFWLAMPLAAALCSICGFLVGMPMLRIKGAYFAIASLCFGVIVTIVISQWSDLTEGEKGLIGIPPPDPIPIPLIDQISFKSLTSRYYLILFFLIVTIIVMHRMAQSLLGRKFMAIRDNEELAESIGINTMRNKVLSFTIGAFFAGLAGALYAGYFGFLSPGCSDYNTGFTFLISVIVGGAGTIAGPIIGAFVMPVLMEIMHALAEYRMLVYGLLLIVIIIFLPGGIVRGAQLLWFWATTSMGRRV